MSGRSKGVLAVVVAGIVMLALSGPAAAVSDEVGAHSGFYAPIAPNARGTDVAAADQQAPRSVVNARGTDVAAPDQQAPVGRPAGSVTSVDTSDDTLPTLALISLIALGLGGLASASWVAASRRRGRAAV